MPGEDARSEFEAGVVAQRIAHTAATKSGERNYNIQFSAEAEPSDDKQRIAGKKEPNRQSGFGEDDEDQFGIS
ncbi:MAG: hypothetical protein WKF84_01005 [Pyrinomonadaceae bacterium]